MHIVVVLSDSLTTAWKHAQSTPVVEELRRALGAHESALRPTHPDTSDPELRRYFALEIDDPGAASRTRERLAATPGVEAAYIKPEEAPP